MICTICPRNCNVDRDFKQGLCLCGNKILINKVMLHHFEEPIISVGKGSGAIFFAGCNMKCVFCQNYPISHNAKGKKVKLTGLVKIFKKLEKLGAANINLVTPTQFSEQIIQALSLYKPKIPVVWNSNGYEKVETIEKLNGLVDIFLVDLKYCNNQLALKYSGCANYVQNAKAAIKKMRQIAPNDIIIDGVMQKGVIVRHLVLPTHTDDSIDCLKFILNNLGKDTIVSIMSQYQPMYNAKLYPEINRKLTNVEYKRVVSFARNNNMLNCFTQGLDSADTKYTPKFK